MPRQAVGWARRLRSTAAQAKTSRPTNNNINESAIALFSSQAQVGEMLECADKVVDRSGRHLNFRAALATERGLSKFLERPDKKRRTRKLSKCLVNGNRQGRDVFLGGSCNPTTWRKDKAIPLLESRSITYYNPQVGEWTSDLVAVEREAKDTARVLFYVLDRSTRNVVGMIEAANFASSRRNLVLVADSYLPQQPIANETISNREFEELCAGLAILKDLLERRGISVFNNIDDAVDHTSKLLHNKKKNGINKVSSLPDKLDQVQVGDKFFALREAFSALDPKNSGKISLKDCCMAYHRLTNKTLSMGDLKNIIWDDSIKKGRMELNSTETLNFQQFCTMINELRLRNGITQSENDLSCPVLGELLHSVLEWSSCSSNLHSKFDHDLLIIASTLDPSWQHSSVTLSVLKTSGMKYWLSEIGGSHPNHSTMLDAMESSRVLLFLITSNTRGLDLMTLASYYIALGCNIILCIQDLKADCIVENERLSKVAINDYNRGRVYLADEARRNGVKVFSNADEALAAAIERVNSS